MERLLVMGVDTVAGNNLANCLQRRFEVLGVARSVPSELHGVRLESHGDDVTTLAGLLRSWRPHWVIGCGSFSGNAWDEPSPPASIELPLVKCLAAVARELSTQVTLISSDVVFCGPRLFHDELSNPACSSARARGVLAVEQHVAGAGALVVRTHVYGWSPVDTSSFAQRAYEAVESGASLAADGCRHATPILATDLAPLMLRAYELRLEGMYHISGAERTSPHRFGSELAAARGGRWNDRTGTSVRSDTVLGETSLSSKRARRVLKMPVPLLREGLMRFIAQAGSLCRDPRRARQSTIAGHELAA